MTMISDQKMEKECVFFSQIIIWVKFANFSSQLAVDYPTRSSFTNLIRATEPPSYPTDKYWVSQTTT